MSDSEQSALTEIEREEWKELADTPHQDLSDKQVTSKIRLSMKRRYSAPEWSLVFEFTGADGRRADAVAVNTFPSRNFKVLGFEFKSSRSDWLAEKREGAKSDYFVRCVDEWYVVAGRRGIIEEKELPEGWGLLELKDNRDDQLWQLVESDLTEHQQGNPDRAFWGRFVQKAVGEDSNFTTEDLEEARRRGYDAAKDDVKQAANRDIDRLEKKAESWDKLADAGFDFIRSYGRMSETDIRRINKAYSLIGALEGSSRRGDFISQLNNLRKQAERTAERVEKGYEEFMEEYEELAELIDNSDKPGGETFESKNAGN